MSAVDVLAVMEDCEAYVDDAAQFPEHFKPGVVKRHQRQYREARAAVAELIEATESYMDPALPLQDVITAGRRVRAALARCQGGAA